MYPHRFTSCLNTEVTRCLCRVCVSVSGRAENFSVQIREGLKSVMNPLPLNCVLWWSPVILGEQDC